MRCALALFVSCLFLVPVSAQDLVAKSDAKTPAEEQKSFRLPKGFEMQLVASEPDIEKPMQMAFDAKGRLWVTTSHHYPFAAESGKGTDRLYVLSDFDETGKAKSVKIFDEKLNIPIGVLPLPDGKSVIVSEAGSIWKLTDTDGDGKADRREKLFSGFGFKDTHGMTNSFTAMADGWIYATHGFANDSQVKGRDGHEITMNSGNTFRFRADGSRIEIFTHGQVNPFGIAVDPWGNLYTACCHSKPITQLIRGGYYDSFGKPHDGLGYAPHVVNHQHGSTGLCGLAWGAGPLFPKEWDGVMFLGNCVTNRINCDRIEWHGSTPVGIEMPDFLSTDDAWFRPVDLKFGPDGALYVSDFYNKIVGHYEVDLKHPGRDKSRGRVWRIVWTGTKRTEKPAEAEDVADVTFLQQLAALPKLGNDGGAEALHALEVAEGKPRVQRVVVDVMAAHPHADFVKPLLALIPKIPADDNHLRHAARIALRNALELPGGVQSPKLTEKPEDIATMLDVAAGLSRPLEFNLNFYLTSGKLSKKARMQAAELHGRFGTFEYWEDFLAYRPKDDPRTEKVKKLEGAELLGAVLRGYAVTKISDATKKLGRERFTLRTTEAAIIDLVASPDLELRQSGFVLLLEWKKLGLLTTDPHSRQSVTLISDRAQNVRLPAVERSLSIEALAILDLDRFRPLAGTWLVEPTLNEASRTRLAQRLLENPTEKDCGVAATVLKTANYSLALVIANGLAVDKFGADLLLLAIKKGEAPVRLLQEKVVVDRLKATKVPGVDARIAELTKGLPAPEKRIDDLIKKRSEGFKTFKSDSAKGKEIFAKNCAACHQVNNEGAKVGPQLDGIGIRGVERLLEDTLDPSRNVDAAFKATTLQLLDGRSLSGLVREDGAVYVLIDNLGKESRIAVKDVEQVVKSNLSAMPANVDAIIPEADYYHLLAFLLSQKPK